jgi:flavin-dependent dehydrogenase
MHPSMREYDLVVIGSGPGGQKAAIAAAKLGKTVAAIEHDPDARRVCTNIGTIPQLQRRCPRFVSCPPAKKASRWPDTSSPRSNTCRV